MDHWITAIIVAIPTALAAYVLYRSKNAEVIKGEMEAWKARAERQAKEREVDAAAIHERDVQIADLKARTDLSGIRDGQAAIMELIAKQSAAILENQSNGMKFAHEIQSALANLNAATVQLVVVVEKMEKRIDRGLIMQ